MKKAFFVLILLTFNHFYTNSQELPDIIPPSPEAASLAKFTDVPISYHTGLANIDIPIFNITEDDFQFPISLSYHPKGIKVGEVASRVGIGWALNCGGTISRQIRGKADDDIENGYLTNGIYNSLFCNTSYRTGLSGNQITNYDFLPDQFYYSGVGFNGKFIFDQVSNSIVNQKFDDLVFTYGMDTYPFSGSSDIIDRFIITDEMGNKFYYGVSKNGQRIAANTDQVQENYVISQETGNLTEITSAEFRAFNSWLLMDIETVKGGLISFFYSEEVSYGVYQRSYDTKEFSGDDEQVSEPGTYGVKSYFNKVDSYQHQLDSITFSKGKVVFTKENTEREDYQGAYALSNIDVYDNNDSFIKGYDFSYIYSTCSHDDNQLPYLKAVEDKADKRLFLESIVERGDDNSLSNPYTFEYNPEPLPNRYSNSQDAWGYYNGKNNGHFLAFFMDGASPNNRRVDIELSEAGMLKKINYPTGGFHQFTYEHNKVEIPYEMDGVAAYSTTPTTDREEGLGPIGDDLVFYNPTTGIFEKPITIGPDLQGPVHVDITIDCYNSCDPLLSEDGCCLCSETTWNPTSGCPFQIWLDNDSGGSIQLFKGNHDISPGSGNFTIRVVPQDPTYDPLPPNLEEDFFNVNLYWYEGIETNVIYAAGKRVSKIEYSSNGQDVDFYREFKYTLPNGEDTSGILFGLPAFYSVNQIMSSQNILVLDPLGAVPGSPLSTYQGEDCGYSMVTEFYGGEENNTGKIERTFTALGDSGEYYEYPQHLPTDNSWLRGKPLSTKYFKTETGGPPNTYSLVKEINNEYLYNNDPQNIIGPGGFISVDFPYAPESIRLDLSEDFCPDPNDPDPAVDEFSYILDSTQFMFPLIHFYYPYDQYGILDPNNKQYVIYHITGGTLDMLSTEEIEYFDDGSILSKSTTYDYAYDYHYQVNQIETSDSRGLLKQTTFEYPVNPTMAGEPNVASMSSKNMIGYPLRTKNLVDRDQDGQIASSEVVNAQKTQYMGSNGLILPSSVLTSKDFPLDFEQRIVFHSYDTNGNLLEVSKEDGTRIMYVWGYNDQYPIAKLENASNTGLTSAQQSAINSVKIASDADVDETSENSLRGELEDLQEAFPEAMVTTYTYDPLVGVTSITDPRGNTIYYQYDDFNRLEHVRDKDGNILSENEYHYANQN